MDEQLEMKESAAARGETQLITGKNVVTSPVHLKRIVLSLTLSFAHASNNVQYVYVYLTRTSCGRVNYSSSFVFT